jgi:hypothetical protein
MAKDVNQKPINISHNPYSDDNAPNVAQPSTGKAFRELPGQYFKVLTKPSVTSFAEE